MSYQHYIPAGFLGRFSSDTKGSYRDRRIFGLNLSETKPAFLTKAAQFNGINNFYTLSDGYNDPNRLDRVWSIYEAGLNDALASLIAGTIDAVTWARILVPFVTGLLVRGPDFDDRFNNRPLIAALKDTIDFPDNTKMIRALEMQYLLGQVTVGEWFVAKTDGQASLITNDIGFIPFGTVRMNKRGIAIPLDQKHLLVVFARTQGPVAFRKDGIWYPTVCRISLDDVDLNGSNLPIARHAKSFLYGGSSEDVEAFRESYPKIDAQVLEPSCMGFLTGRQARLNEFTWHRFVSFLYRPTSNGTNSDFSIDWDALDDPLLWNPIVMFPLFALPFCPPSISIENDHVLIDLSKTEGASKRPVQSYIERRWTGLGKLYSCLQPDL